MDDGAAVVVVVVVVAVLVVVVRGTVLVGGSAVVDVFAFNGGAVVDTKAVVVVVVVDVVDVVVDVDVDNVDVDDEATVEGDRAGTVDALVDALAAGVLVEFWAATPAASSSTSASRPVIARPWQEIGKEERRKGRERGKWW